MALGQNAPWIMIVFPIAHVAVGLGLTYFTLSGFVNSSVVTVDREKLSVRHGPLPWPGNLDLPVEQIKQVFCEQRTHHGRNNTSFSYVVQVILQDDTKKSLLMSTELGHAKFFEQEIERYLNIPPRHVPGEVL
jgi:hypothetical protein